MAKYACPNCDRTFRTTNGLAWHKKNTCDGSASSRPSAKKKRTSRESRASSSSSRSRSSRSSSARVPAAKLREFDFSSKPFPKDGWLEASLYWEEDSPSKPSKKYLLRTTPHPYASGKVYWYGEYIPLKGKTYAQLEKEFAKVVKRLGTQDVFYEGLLATRRSKDGVPVYGAATGT